MTTDILFERRGAAGLVTLNRPRALNALTHAMVRALAAQLADWARDDAVSRVIVTAEGERAFCAGGDIRALYDLGRAGRQDEQLAFFREEYTLNTAIKRFPKPYIALIDGLVMGGGVGISIHGSHRVAGERYAFAMPEVGIGFFPDVGATYALPQMAGEIGTFCAVTGERLSTADAVAAGAATHHVRSARFPDLREALCGTVPPDAVIAAFAEPREAGPVMQRRAVIDRLFAPARIEDILAALDAEAASGSADAGWAAGIATTMRTKSPTSLKIAREQMRRGRTLSFEDCMQTEFRIVSRIVYGSEFYEGIRAVIIDKDNKPDWRPAALAEIGETEIARYFAPLEGEELDLT
ncbi:MAG: enoyl-CoA hydratase/isomerase family protein [Pseudorhodoplanes sp.]|nr:enoyl-CoA hydratase/isomerase family protein [Pseudorhodoplanes sp.]